MIEEKLNIAQSRKGQRGIKWRSVRQPIEEESPNAFLSCDFAALREIFLRPTKRRELPSTRSSFFLSCFFLFPFPTVSLSVTLKDRSASPCNCWGGRFMKTKRYLAAALGTFSLALFASFT